MLYIRYPFASELTEVKRLISLFICVQYPKRDLISTKSRTEHWKQPEYRDGSGTPPLARGRQELLRNADEETNTNVNRLRLRDVRPIYLASVANKNRRRDANL